MEDERTPFWKRRWVWAAGVVIGAPALWLGWWLGSPLFLNKTVIEAFPTVSAPQAVETEPSPVTAAPADVPSTTGVSVSEPETTDDPIAITTGEFVDFDARHKGSGQATIYQIGTGYVLRFENLDVTNGPDLHVILTPAGSINGHDDLEEAGYVDLGELKGNQGDQNYNIAASVDIEAQMTVVIYCVPFHVVFSTAALSPAG